MAGVIVVCGRIASGKTTYAQRICADGRTVLLSIDEVMLAVFGQYAGERHDEYAGRVERYLLRKSVELTRAGVDVVLDWGFWTREGRARLRAFYAARGIACAFHGIRIDDDTWHKRLQKRNRAVREGAEEAYEVDENLLAKFLSRYEEPGGDEIDVWVDQP